MRCCGRRELDRSDIPPTTLWSGRTEEVGGGVRTCRGARIGRRRAWVRRVGAEHNAGDRVRQRQWAPADVDPVVAFVHRRGRRQVEDWGGYGRVRTARRHLEAARLKLGWRE